MGRVAILHPQTCLKENLMPTPMKSRRTIRFNSTFTNPPPRTPNSALPDSRRRTPPKGILKKPDRNKEAVATDSPAPTVSKNLVMGQVKILKRGEVLNEPSTILQEVNDRKLSNGAASTPEKDLVTDTSEVVIKVLPTKKKAEKNRAKKVLFNSKPKAEAKVEDLCISSTDRLGPDPEIVSKQMKKITECFAGSAFSDSPPPSSVPLPGFFRKDFVAAGKNDATSDLRRILGLSLC